MTEKCDRYMRDKIKAEMDAECAPVALESSATKVLTCSSLDANRTNRLPGQKALLLEVSEKDIGQSLSTYFMVSLNSVV